MPTRLIIDTDTAADDCFAILVGLLHPEAHLEAITIVAGNVAFDQQVKNALITLEAAGRGGSVPVFPGSRRPLLRDWVSAEYVHLDGKGGASWPEPAQAPEREHAVDALIRLVDANPGELSLVAIGPLTNVALAVARDPEFARKLGALYVMGGSNNARGNITPAAEYNFYVDPEAARIVFRAGFEVTVVTWDLTLRQAVFGRERLDRIRALGTPLARFFDIVNGPTLAFDERVGIPGSTHPDALTCLVAVQPSIVRRTAPYHIDIETQGELTRGYSVFDWGVFGRPPNARVVEEIDAEGFYETFVGLLSGGAGR